MDLSLGERMIHLIAQRVLDSLGACHLPALEEEEARYLKNIQVEVGFALCIVGILSVSGVNAKIPAALKSAALVFAGTSPRLHDVSRESSDILPADLPAHLGSWWEMPHGDSKLIQELAEVYGEGNGFPSRETALQAGEVANLTEGEVAALLECFKVVARTYGDTKEAFHRVIERRTEEAVALGGGQCCRIPYSFGGFTQAAAFVRKKIEYCIYLPWKAAYTNRIAPGGILRVKEVNQCNRFKAIDETTAE